MDLNGVQVAPFGPKLGQNDAPELRIIFQALLGPKTLFKNQKHLKIAPGGRRQGAKPLRSATVPSGTRVACFDGGLRLHFAYCV